MKNLNSSAQLLVTVLLIIAIVCLIYFLAQFIPEFSRELKYINIEIERTDGAEQRYWKRRKRRLWLSLIPFVKY